MRIWTGTCGYSYADWVGPFYPRGTRPPQMLPLYSRAFPAVELNFTFYRAPTPAVLARLSGQTPPGFRFLVKLPRTVSHARETHDLPAVRASAARLQEDGRLLGLLCQLPPSAREGKPARAWLERLGKELAGLGMAVEFRHHSWARPDVPRWLEDLGLGLVSVDVPALPKLYPRGLVGCGRRAYVRLHSRDAAVWYGGEKKRYDYDYSDAELSEWVESLRAEAGRFDEALFLFNNCYGAQAIENARRLEKLLRRDAPDWEVVSPPPPAAHHGP